MTVMTILSILLAIIPVVIVTWRRGELPESISAMVYELPDRWRWLWSVWIWAVSLLTLIPAITVLDRIGMGFLGFGTLACLVFCAAMPIFMEDKKDWHDILGISSCILSQICVFFIEASCLFAWAWFVLLMRSGNIQPEGWIAKAVKGKGVFVAEMMCYITQEGSLLTIQLF